MEVRPRGLEASCGRVRQRPNLVRILAAAEIGSGLWLPMLSYVIVLVSGFNPQLGHRKHGSILQRLVLGTYIVSLLVALVTLYLFSGEIGVRIF